MRFEYDKEANALYIYLRGKIPEGGVARTVELAPGVYLDADGACRILGVEFPGLCGIHRSAWKPNSRRFRVALALCSGSSYVEPRGLIARHT